MSIQFKPRLIDSFLTPGKVIQRGTRRPIVSSANWISTCSQIGPIAQVLKTTLQVSNVPYQLQLCIKKWIQLSFVLFLFSSSALYT